MYEHSSDIFDFGNKFPSDFFELNSYQSIGKT